MILNEINSFKLNYIEKMKIIDLLAKDRYNNTFCHLNLDNKGLYLQKDKDKEKDPN